MRKALIAIVRFYQRYLSPISSGTCRFRPTCSQYMIEAIDKHGFKGMLMGIARIMRCHPWSKTGFDPVPDHFSLKRHSKNDSQK
ncbi:membrane protein insertion efficiency factor YidD [Streptococcus jiangjianxini]|uniref:membrane protein insertion efficiency factor YidD n=1 Tax=Streptococcus jiangjianxini TaxID=3161189 RepID=UPI0032EEA50C